MSDGRNESSIFAGAEDDEALDILWSMVMEGNEIKMLLQCPLALALAWIKIYF